MKPRSLYYKIVTLIFILFGFYNFEIVSISGPSMEPTYKSGDKVLASRFLLWFHHIDIGDVIVFPNPDNGETLIKRVIRIRKDQVWVEGDNRSNSTDSRDFGPITFKSINAKVW